MLSKGLSLDPFLSRKRRILHSNNGRFPRAGKREVFNKGWKLYHTQWCGKFVLHLSV